MTSSGQSAIATSLPALASTYYSLHFPTHAAGLIYGESTGNMVLALGGVNRPSRIDSIKSLGQVMSRVCLEPNADVRFDVGPNLDAPFHPGGPPYSRGSIRSAQLVLDTDAPAMTEFRALCGCRDLNQLCALCWTATVLLHQASIALVQKVMKQVGCRPLTYFTWGRGAHTAFLNEDASQLSRTMRTYVLGFLLGPRSEHSKQNMREAWQREASQEAKSLLMQLSKDNEEVYWAAVESCVKAVDDGLADPKHLHRGVFSARDNGGIVAPVRLEEAREDPALLHALLASESAMDRGNQWVNYTKKSPLFVRYDVDQQGLMHDGLRRAERIVEELV